MVQDRTALAPFFNEHINNNSRYSPKWGPAYHQMVKRVATERPEFRDQSLIKALWYERSNGVASIKQGGMSQNEYNAAQIHLREITTLMAQGCTPAVYEKVVNKLQALKAKSILKKQYWALCHRAFATLYPERVSNVVNTKMFSRIYNYCNNRFGLGLAGKGTWFEKNLELKAALNRELGGHVDTVELNMSLWHLYTHFIKDKSDIGLVGSESWAEDDDQDTDESVADVPLNVILYGPPGTGKTYSSVEHAVRACEPAEYSRLLDGLQGSDYRNALKALYDRLVSEQRIRFVTFHQSFGYEEFIEGLRADTTRDGNVRYDIKSGVFKQICEDAAFGYAGEQLALNEALSKFQKELLNGEAATLKTTSGKPFGVTYKSETNFGIFPLNSKKGDLGNGYNAYVKDIKAWYQNNGIDIHNESYVRGILNYLHDNYNLPVTPKKNAPAKRQNYVLIVDEINRGNISKIFGELITLIEKSKRMGEPEALSVTLPYSGEKFSVPNNLFLVGTMNTADRSLTALDTALRRRFEFKAMLPKASILEGHVIKGIDLKRLLQMLNERIEALYDSEHTLGHAFFIPVIETEDDDVAFARLQRVIKNKVLPLLEEYFYNDWQKIRLVLGDNQKQDPALCFIRSIKNEGNIQRLFGTDASDDLQEEGERYHLAGEDDPVWNNAIAWRQIYDAGARGAENDE